MNNADWVDLADAISQLRAQLSQARAEAVGEDVLFTVGKAEVELTVEARREAGGGGGIKFGVVSIEGKGSVASAATHKIKLELTPHDRDGRPIDVADQVGAPPAR